MKWDMKPNTITATDMKQSNTGNQDVNLNWTVESKNKTHLNQGFQKL